MSLFLICHQSPLLPLLSLCWESISYWSAGKGWKLLCYRQSCSVLFPDIMTLCYITKQLLLFTDRIICCITPALKTCADDHRNLIKAQNEMCCVTMNTQRLRVNKAQPVVTFQDPGLFFPFPKNIAFGSTWWFRSLSQLRNTNSIIFSYIIV